MTTNRYGANQFEVGQTVTVRSGSFKSYTIGTAEVVRASASSVTVKLTSLAADDRGGWRKVGDQLRFKQNGFLDMMVAGEWGTYGNGKTIHA